MKLPKLSSRHCALAPVVLLAAVLSAPAVADTIYFADLFFPTFEDGSIRSITHDGFDLQDVLPTGSGVRGLDVDAAAGKIYWVDVNAYAIRRANLDGTNVEDLVTTGLVFPSAIALDVPGGKFYWGDQVDETIQRANLDGTNVEFVTSTPFHRGIAIDSAGGKVYWSTSTNVSKGDIRRCNFDGTDQEIVFSSPDTNFKPADIALDLAAGKVYWSDYVARAVRRGDINGSSYDNLFSLFGYAPRGIALDLARGQLYIGQDYGDEPTTGRIYRIPLDGTFSELIAWDLGLVNDMVLLPDAPPPACTGDLNGDYLVDLQDLAALLGHYGTPSGASPGDGDLDADGDVDLQDLASMLANFGTICP
ncbi:MAG: hypothetical protein AMXMBFR47_32440 [Planctomycetota bacterium]